MSNIGGLVGLWFGFAFIDTSALITLAISYTKLILNNYLICKINYEKFKKFDIESINLYISLLNKIYEINTSATY